MKDNCGHTGFPTVWLMVGHPLWPSKVRPLRCGWVAEAGEQC